MADYIRPTPRNPILGLLADALTGGVEWMRDRRQTQQMQGLGGLLAETGIPATMERLSYGEPLTKGKGMTTRLRPEAEAALMTLGPEAVPIGRGAAAAVKATKGLPVGAATVYHGSPYRFQRFDPTKIGSGEGAQSYGYGHYVAESPAVAKGYQETLSYKAFDLSPEAEKRGLNLSAGARGEFMRQVRTDAPPEVLAKRLQNANISARSLPQEKLADLFKAYKEQGGGALYTIDLPDPAIARMLDWDKPLSEQYSIAERMKNALTGPGSPLSPVRRFEAKDWLTDPVRMRNLSPQSFADLKDPQIVEQLRQAGIPGIRYLDQGSRGAGQGTSNFVVFPGEEDLLRILSVDGGLLGR